MVGTSMVRSEYISDIADAKASAVGDVNDSFDVDEVIAGFQADPNCASLELPRLLSAEQRKHVKKVAEGYPGVKCESFGMGNDRQLHLFKSINEEAALECSPHRVSVKNTFIDDWVNAGAPANARNVQSMPHNMFGQCLYAELSEQAESPADDKEEAADNTSTHSSENGSRLGRWADQEVEEGRTDSTKATMSQPTCLPSAPFQLFPLGAEVVIDGLVKAPMFNGAAGVVQSWDAETGRYNVLLAGQRWAKIKGENLRYLAQPR